MARSQNATDTCISAHSPAMLRAAAAIVINDADRVGFGEGRGHRMRYGLAVVAVGLWLVGCASGELVNTDGIDTSDGRDVGRTDPVRDVGATDGPAADAVSPADTDPDGLPPQDVSPSPDALPGDADNDPAAPDAAGDTVIGGDTDVGQDVDVTPDTNPADVALDGDTGTTEDTRDDVAPDAPLDATPDVPPPTGPIACTAANAATVCPTGSPCVDGFCCDGVCAGDCARCDVPGRQGQCSFLPATTVCRESSGPCDLAEQCDGDKAGCPLDAKAPVGTACGSSSTSACDAADSCTEDGTCAPNTVADGGVCLAPPPGYCSEGSAFNPTGAGTCTAGTCTAPVLGEACAGNCSVAGTLATCANCNDAFLPILAGPVWGFDAGTTGWTLAGDWRRTTGARRSGSHGLDTNGSSFEYDDSASYRMQWSASYDMTRCAACPLSVSLWVRGSTEQNYDGITVQCSGNGGSNWSDAGDLISGSYGSWTQVVRTLPESCRTSQMRVALRFSSDFSWTDSGYYVDDVRLFTTPTAPVGYLDNADATVLNGWACDGDAWSDEGAVRLLFFRNGSGEPLERVVVAGDVRADLVTAGVCGGTGNHGYTFAYDAALLAWLGAGTHTVRAYAIDGPAPCGAGTSELAGSPRTFLR